MATRRGDWAYKLLYLLGSEVCCALCCQADVASSHADYSATAVVAKVYVDATTMDCMDETHRQTGTPLWRVAVEAITRAHAENQITHEVRASSVEALVRLFPTEPHRKFLAHGNIKASASLSHAENSTNRHMVGMAGATFIRVLRVEVYELTFHGHVLIQLSWGWRGEPDQKMR